MKMMNFLIGSLFIVLSLQSMANVDCKKQLSDAANDVTYQFHTEDKKNLAIDVQWEGKSVRFPISFDLKDLRNIKARVLKPANQTEPLVIVYSTSEKSRYNIHLYDVQTKQVKVLDRDRRFDVMKLLSRPQISEFNVSADGNYLFGVYEGQTSLKYTDNYSTPGPGSSIRWYERPTSMVVINVKADKVEVLHSNGHLVFSERSNKILEYEFVHLPRTSNAFGGYPNFRLTNLDNGTTSNIVLNGIYKVNKVLKPTASADFAFEAVTYNSSNSLVNVNVFLTPNDRVGVQPQIEN